MRVKEEIRDSGQCQDFEGRVGRANRVKREGRGRGEADLERVAGVYLKRGGAIRARGWFVPAGEVFGERVNSAGRVVWLGREQANQLAEVGVAGAGAGCSTTGGWEAYITMGDESELEMITPRIVVATPIEAMTNPVAAMNALIVSVRRRSNEAETLISKVLLLDFASVSTEFILSSRTASRRRVSLESSGCMEVI